MATYLECINLQCIPKGHWTKNKVHNMPNLTAFCKHLGIKLGYTKPEDWYHLTYLHGFLKKY